MTLEDIKTRPDFVSLTERLKKFTLGMCSNGRDKLAAGKTAFKGSTDGSILAQANTALKHPSVSLIINEFYGTAVQTGNKDLFLAFIWNKIQNCGADSKLLTECLKLYADCSGFRTERAPAEPPKVESEDWEARLKAVKGE